MKITGSGIALASDGGGRSSLCFPRIAVLPGGRWLVAARAAVAKNDELSQRTLVTWSDDEGRTWREPTDPFVPPDVDGRAGQFRTGCPRALRDGRVVAALAWQDISRPDRPMFNPETEGTVDFRVFLSTSDDRGATWSPPVRVHENPYERVPVALTGPVLELPDGRLGCNFELQKPYESTAPWEHAAVMMFSRDGGRTWGEVADVARDPAGRYLYWDQRLAVLPDGRVFGLFWTLDRSTGGYVNIRAAESADGGRTWSAPRDTGVPGQPASPVPLSGGRVAMVYIDREGEPMLKARLSPDGGRTFPASTEFTLDRRQLPSQTWQKRGGDSADAWAELGAFSFGLPDAVALNDNESLVVHYTGPHRDHTDIRWTRVSV